MDTVWLEVVLILVAIIANGFFSGSEIAMVSARPSRLAQLRDEGVRGAQRALDLKATPETFLATVQIAITLVGTLASAVGGAAAVEVLTPKITALPIAGAERWAEPAALAVVIVVITFVIVIADVSVVSENDQLATEANIDEVGIVSFDLDEALESHVAERGVVLEDEYVAGNDGPACIVAVSARLAH